MDINMISNIQLLTTFFLLCYICEPGKNTIVKQLFKAVTSQGVEYLTALEYGFS
jgi:hypothetical protein